MINFPLSKSIWILSLSMNHLALGTPHMEVIPGGEFEPLFVNPAFEQSDSLAVVKSFRLAIAPVTNEEFANFVGTNPNWRRDNINPIFADQAYLQHWLAPLNPSKDQLQLPVVNVSWHAAKAYCTTIGGRLPTDLEWQFAAYEGSPNYQAILRDWYSKPNNAKLPLVKSTTPNKFNLHDMYGPIWEWVSDFGSMMIAGDSRSASGTDSLAFCGSGAVNATEPQNYIGFMRAAYLNSLKANYTTSSLGFRCAQNINEGDSR